ncbi:thioredoxin fold domain-containing protein [Pseudomonas sp. HK3]|jgi:thiol:disulfide interchange protein DsbC
MAILRILGASALILLANLATAEEVSVEETIAKSLRAAQPTLVLLSAKQVPGQDLYEVELTSGEVLYSTSDGQYFVYGSLFQATKGELVNITAKRSDEKRLALMDKLDPKDMVVFSSKGEEKAVINVFTDVDCGYCRKLHREVPRLNELGVTVRYMAYPRAGIYSDQKRTQFTGSYKKLKSVWCDADRTGAMNKAKATGFIKENLSCDAPIEEQLALGAEFGVRGTPAIILQDGELLPGYMPADELAKKIGL